MTVRPKWWMYVLFVVVVTPAVVMAWYGEPRALLILAAMPLGSLLLVVLFIAYARWSGR